MSFSLDIVLTAEICKLTLSIRQKENKIAVISSLVYSWD